MEQRWIEYTPSAIPGYGAQGRALVARRSGVGFDWEGGHRASGGKMRGGAASGRVYFIVASRGEASGAMPRNQQTARVSLRNSVLLNPVAGRPSVGAEKDVLLARGPRVKSAFDR